MTCQIKHLVQHTYGSGFMTAFKPFHQLEGPRGGTQRPSLFLGFLQSFQFPVCSEIQHLNVHLASGGVCRAGRGASGGVCRAGLCEEEQSHFLRTRPQKEKLSVNLLHGIIQGGRKSIKGALFCSLCDWEAA